MTQQPLIPLSEAAKTLDVHKETLLRAIRAGQLEAIKLGRSYKVTEQGIQGYVKKKTVNGGEKSDHK